MAKMKAKTKKVAKIVGMILAVVVTLGAVVAIASKCDSEKTKELGAFDYKIGQLSDIDGKSIKDDKSGLVSKDIYDIDGLTVELEKDAEVKYQLNFYDADKEWLSVSTYEEDFDGDQVETLKTIGAEYVRIEIIPLDDEDGKVGIFEKSTYVKQLTVTVSTEEDVEESEKETETEDTSSDATSEEGSTAA